MSFLRGEKSFGGPCRNGVAEEVLPAGTLKMYRRSHRKNKPLTSRALSAPAGMSTTGSAQRIVANGQVARGFAVRGGVLVLWNKTPTERKVL